MLKKVKHQAKVIKNKVKDFILNNLGVTSEDLEVRNRIKKKDASK